MVKKAVLGSKEDDAEWMVPPVKVKWQMDNH